MVSGTRTKTKSHPKAAIPAYNQNAPALVNARVRCKNVIEMTRLHAHYRVCECLRMQVMGTTVYEIAFRNAIPTMPYPQGILSVDLLKNKRSIIVAKSFSSLRVPSVTLSVRGTG